MINEHPIVEEFIKDNAPGIPLKKTEEWKDIHARQSQYSPQIVKCEDPDGCIPLRSSYLTIVKDRFLPPPVPIIEGKNGFQWATYLRLHQKLAIKDKLIPFSLTRRYPTFPYVPACPSVKEDLKKRICCECGVCFGSIKEMLVHKKWCTNRIVNITESALK